MNIRKSTVNAATIQHANARHKSTLKFWRLRLARIDNDDDRQQRLAAAQCPMCWKHTRIGGAQVTRAECAHCDTMLTSGNTAVDFLCLPCAVKASVCQSCGADLDLHNRARNGDGQLPNRGDSK